MNHPSYPAPYSGQVNTVYILNTGEVISSPKEYMEVESRFAWASKLLIVTRILQLRSLTDCDKQSLIAIYEEGHLIKEFVNVERGVYSS